MHIVSHLAFAAHFLTINVVWNFAYMCTSLPNIISKCQIWKEHVNCLWLSVEDEFVQNVLNIVRQCIFTIQILVPFTSISIHRFYDERWPFAP